MWTYKVEQDHSLIITSVSKMFIYLNLCITQFKNLMENDQLRDASLAYTLVRWLSIINHVMPLLYGLFAYLMNESFVVGLFTYWMTIKSLLVV